MPSLGTLRVNKNFAGIALIDFGEDVSMCTMTARIYTTPPVNGVGGTLLFDAKTLIPNTGASPTANPNTFQQGIPLDAEDTDVPTGGRALYSELDVVYEDGQNLAQEFYFIIDGH